MRIPMTFRSLVYTSFCLLLGGCFGTEPPTRFYLLSTLPEEYRHAGPERALAIAIGPVRFPDYLDRPGIATGDSPNRLTFSTYHQWAEPLKNNFERVVGDNLSLLIPTDSIVAFPWDRTTRVDYQVTMDVVRFGLDANDECRLTVRWRIVDRSTKTTRIIRTSDIRTPVTDSGYQSIVEAQSRALGELSEVIAGALRALPAPPASG